MTAPLNRRAGLIPGGRDGPGTELLEDGQEEVFSRTEVRAAASNTRRRRTPPTASSRRATKSSRNTRTPPLWTPA